MMEETTLYQAFLAAVRSLDPAQLVRARVPNWRGRAVAIGKAAGAMAAGLPAAVGRLVISPYPGQGFQSSHPLLSSRSYVAGKALLDFLKGPEETLFLISGGASALVEVAPEGQDPQAWIEEWPRLYRQGLDIVAMNRIRARHSAIKGGGLLDFLQGPSLTLLLSDVLQGPQWVGSGLTWRDPQPSQHPLEVLADGRALAEAVARQLPEVECLIQKPICTSLDQALQQIQSWAPAPGQAFLAPAEVTLPVRGSGRGGRCQHLAAAAIGWLRSRPFKLLVAASDGADGPTPAAGACVDGTLPDPAAFLKNDDSYGFFRSIARNWEPGPTGNNLNDLILLINPGSRPTLQPRN
jgi:glycerate 2-kinase